MDFRANFANACKSTGFICSILAKNVAQKACVSLWPPGKNSVS